MSELFSTPEWLDGNEHIIGLVFCDWFLYHYPMRCIHDHFCAVDGLVAEETSIKRDIYIAIEEYVDAGIAKKVDHLFSALKIRAYSEPPSLANRPHPHGQRHLSHGRHVYQKQGVLHESADCQVCTGRTATYKMAAIPVGASVECKMDVGAQGCPEPDSMRRSSRQKGKSIMSANKGTLTKNGRSVITFGGKCQRGQETG
ncbi:MAG: hypothetical protein LUC47_09965 [Clostridiales bacterium]|nr:hypothetical protein [Clostridiales bacterium]